MENKYSHEYIRNKYINKSNIKFLKMKYNQYLYEHIYIIKRYYIKEDIIN